MKKLLLLVTFFVGANVFARGALRLDQPSALTCNSLGEKLVCYIQAHPEWTITVDPDKSISVGRTDQVKQEFKAAIAANESSRIIACIGNPGRQFIAGFLLSQKEDNQNTFSIDLDYDNQPQGQPLLYFSPYQDPYTNLSVFSPAKACAIAFKEFNK